MTTPFALAEYAAVPYQATICGPRCSGMSDELNNENKSTLLGALLLTTGITYAAGVIFCSITQPWLVLIAMSPYICYDANKHIQRYQRQNNLNYVRSIIEQPESNNTTQLTSTPVNIDKLLINLERNGQLFNRFSANIKKKYKRSFFFTSKNSSQLLFTLDKENNNKQPKLSALTKYIHNKKNHGNRLFRTIIETARESEFSSTISI
jgi:hypothetical protein